MATNTLLTIDMITRETLVVLKNSLAFGNRVLRQYDKQFGVDGAKIGDTLRLRKPIRVVPTSGPAPSAQDTTETQIPVASQTQLNVELSYTTKDLSLSLESFSDNMISPIMAQLAATIDSQGMSTVTGYTIANGAYAGNYGSVFNLATPGNISATAGPAAWTGAPVGQAATTSFAALDPFLQAQARITEQSAPDMDRYVVLSPSANAYTVSKLLTLFQPSEEIARQYREGIMGTAAGAKWFVSQSVQNFTAGNWTNSANQQVNVTSTSGDTTLTVKGTGSGCTFKQGDQFTVDGVHSVNPLTRISTGFLQVFVVTATTNAVSTNATLPVYPAIISSGQYQTVDSLPQSGALVTMAGTSAASTAVNLYYQKNAFVLVVAPLADVGSYGAKCVRVDNPEDGFSIRYVEQYQASTDQVVKRFDVLFGWGVARPELACRIQG